MKTLTFEIGDGGKVIHTRERRRGAKVYNQEIWEEEEQREEQKKNKYQKWIELDGMGGISLQL